MHSEEETSSEETDGTPKPEKVADGALKGPQFETATEYGNSEEVVEKQLQMTLKKF